LTAEVNTELNDVIRIRVTGMSNIICATAAGSYKEGVLITTGHTLNPQSVFDTGGGGIDMVCRGWKEPTEAVVTSQDQVAGEESKD